jgi:hypothetical protein
MKLIALDNRSSRCRPRGEKHKVVIESAYSVCPQLSISGMSFACVVAPPSSPRVGENASRCSSILGAESLAEYSVTPGASREVSMLLNHAPHDIAEPQATSGIRSSWALVLLSCWDCQALGTVPPGGCKPTLAWRIVWMNSSVNTMDAPTMHGIPGLSDSAPRVHPSLYSRQSTPAHEQRSSAAQ